MMSYKLPQCTFGACMPSPLLALFFPSRGRLSCWAIFSVSFGAFFYATRHVPATGWRMRVFVLARFADPKADGVWWKFRHDSVHMNEARGSFLKPGLEFSPSAMP